MSFIIPESLNRQDYKNIRLTIPETIIYILIYLVLVMAVSILFYNSLFAGVLMLPFVFIWIRLMKQEKRRKALEEFTEEFKTMLSSLSANMRVGYSLEMAFYPVHDELKGTYGEDSYIARELWVIIQGLRLHQNIESLLYDMADRTGLPDVEEFAGAISTSRRSGGNIIALLKKQSESIARKQDVENQIKTLVSAKKLEHKIMCVMPFGILLYMRATDPEYMSAIYGNALGIIVMTICLILIALTMLWGRRIVDIKV